MNAFAFLLMIWLVVLWMWSLILGIASYERASGESLACGTILLLLLWIILIPAVVEVVTKTIFTVGNIIKSFVVKDPERSPLVASALTVAIGLLGMSILTLILWLWQKSLFPPF